MPGIPARSTVYQRLSIHYKVQAVDSQTPRNRFGEKAGNAHEQITQRHETNI
jgi:hypothetical protein